MNQKSLSQMLRLLVVLVAAAGAAISARLVRYGYQLCQERGQSGLFLPWLIFFLLTLAAVYAALWLAWRMFASIGRDQSFSAENARRLKYMSWLACGDAVAYLLALPVLNAVTSIKPYTVLVLLALSFVGVCLSVACACLSHLVKKAADLKQDQDLTI